MRDRGISPSFLFVAAVTSFNISAILLLFVKRFFAYSVSQDEISSNHWTVKSDSLWYKVKCYMKSTSTRRHINGSCNLPEDGSETWKTTQPFVLNRCHQGGGGTMPSLWEGASASRCELQLSILVSSATLVWFVAGYCVKLCLSVFWANIKAIHLRSRWWFRV